MTETNESTIYDSLTCEVLKLKSRREWLDWRTATPRVGGSEIGALFGCGRESQYSLWTRRIEPELTQADAADESEAMAFGNIMERPILERYEKQTGHPVYPWKQTEICASTAFAGFCTLDAIAFDDDGAYLVEVKAWDENSSWLWAEGPPASILCQVQQQMAVSGIHRAVIVVLFGNRIHRLRIIPVPYDPAFGADIAERCDRFAAYVTERVEPPVDESSMTYDAISRLHPDDNGETVELPADSDQWSAEWDLLKAQEKELKQRLDWLKNQLCAAIGDATFGETPDGRRWSWKTQERGEYTVKPTSFRVLRSSK